MVSYNGIHLAFTPYLTSASTFALPLAPFFVVIKTTPLAARLPYRAVAVASFKTVVDSISEGLMPLKSAPNGIPSTTYSGALLELTEPIPRILIVAFVPGCPLVLMTCTPATSPCKALLTSVGLFIDIFSPETCAAEPVKDFFVAVP